MSAVLVDGQRSRALRQVVDEGDLGHGSRGSLDRRPGERAAVGPHPGLRAVRHDRDLCPPHVDLDVAAGQHLRDPQGLLERGRLRDVAARLTRHDQRAPHVGVEGAVEGVLPGAQGRRDHEGPGGVGRDDQVEERVSLGPDRVRGDRVRHVVVVHDRDGAATLDRDRLRGEAAGRSADRDHDRRRPAGRPGAATPPRCVSGTSSGSAAVTPTATAMTATMPSLPTPQPTAESARPPSTPRAEVCGHEAAYRQPVSALANPLARCRV